MVLMMAPSNRDGRLRSACWLALLWLAAATCFGCGDRIVSTAVRNERVWPFAATSIWNTAIGSGARLVPAGLEPVQYAGWGHVVFVEVTAADPERRLWAPGAGANGRCGGTLAMGSVKVPDAFLLPAAFAENAGISISLLQPDGHTLFEISGFSRCAPSGDVYGFRFPDGDLRGDGRQGGQGGSGLSALGGTLRQGELINGRPVLHALKVSLWGRLYYHDDRERADGCYRWPADRCDAGHAAAAPLGYGGSNPELTMGSLLALPATVSAEDLRLETAEGRLLLDVLTNYGAYVVGNLDSDGIQFSIEHPQEAAFEATVGPKGGMAAWLRDVNRLLPLLAVVANNGPQSIAGGGTPRVPLPPPLAE